MNHRSIVPIVVIAAACSAGLVACDKSGGGGDNSAPTASASAPAVVAPSAPATAASAPSAPPSAAHAVDASTAMTSERRHVGLAGILLKAAYDLPLTDAQNKALDAADSQLYPSGAPSPWAAASTFQGDLVAGIRANKIDAAALKADEAAFDKAVAAGQAAEADALNTLHAALDPATRKALVDAVKQKRSRYDHDKDGLLTASAGDAGAPDWVKQRLEHLTKQLGLDDGQQKQVAALLAKDTGLTPAALSARRDAMQKRVDALLTDFPKDTFDAKKADLAAPPGKTPHDRLDQALSFAMGILPLLKPDQVAKFADQTERMGSRPERYMEDIEHGPPPATAADEPFVR